MAARKAKAVVSRASDVKVPAKPKTDDQEAVLYRSQSSVTVKRDSKGNRQYEVKAYADTPEEAVEKAQEMAAAMDKFIDGLSKGKE